MIIRKQLLLILFAVGAVSASESLDRAYQVRNNEVKLNELRDEALKEVAELISNTNLRRINKKEIRDKVTTLKKEIKAITQLIIN